MAVAAPHFAGARNSCCRPPGERFGRGSRPAVLGHQEFFFIALLRRRPLSGALCRALGRGSGVLVRGFKHDVGADDR